MLQMKILLVKPSFKTKKIIILTAITIYDWKENTQLHHCFFNRWGRNGICILGRAFASEQKSRY